jgi:hypothetical protein
MKNYLRQNTIQVLALLILSVISLWIVSEAEPYAAGDGPEYSLMTEALFNHLSPNVEAADCESFKIAYAKTDAWEKNYKVLAYEEAQAFISETNYKALDFGSAFFVDKDGKKYSCHFFFYSLVNVPMRWVCSLFTINPLKGFYFTNLLLILVSCFIFFRYSKFGQFETTAFVFFFFFSTNYWYLCWAHPEVSTVCFVSMGLWLFFQQKYYTGLLLISVAGLQNQPLGLLVAVLCFVVLYAKGFNLKNLLKICLSSFLIFIPSLFYYYHYGTTNLINYQWPLDVNNISANRVIGFFFDLNQGMVLAFPFILFAYIFLIIRKIFGFKSSSVKWDIFIPVVVLAMTIIVSAIVTWNMGQAVVSRYVTYMSAIVLVHFFILVMQIESKVKRDIILVISIVTQFATTIYFQSMSKFDWSTNQPKPISNWMLKNYPKFYTPDPSIFLQRYAFKIAENPAKSPAFYMKEDGTIIKLLVHKKYLNNLKDFGISQAQIDSLGLILKYINDWSYIDISDQFTPVVSNEKRIAMEIDVIKSNPTWYEAIKQKAITNGISEEETLRRDAAYILGINIVKNGTKEEKIQNKINEIKANPSWLKLIEIKARDRNIPLDEIIMQDATWMVDNEK